MARKRKKNDEEAEVPLSAMIDVVFLLLIYFVVTFKPQIVEAHMNINLPSPSPAPADPDSKPPVLFEVHVMPNDEYLLMGRSRATIPELENRLIEIGTLDPSQTVIIKVDGDAREGSLVRLLDICAKAGLTSLNVVSLNSGR